MLPEETRLLAMEQAIAGTALYLSPKSREKLRQSVAAERGEQSYSKCH